MDGQMRGTIELPGHRLTIGANGDVKAAIKANYVIVIGSVEGNIEATDRVEPVHKAEFLGISKPPAY